MRDITVGYLRPQRELFISSIINTNIFLDALAHYVKVITITTDLKDFNLRKLECLDIDYLLVNIKEYGERQFLLREKQKANIRFIIILRTVFAWVEPLVTIIPLIRKEDIIIAPSEYAKNSFLRITDKFKVHVISHCLDVQKIQKSIPCKFIRQKTKNIAFMGRLIEEKGIGTLIDCMPEIISKLGDVHLNIIGPLSGTGMIGFSESAYVKKLKRKVTKFRLTNNVHFLGLKFDLEKYKILSLADIFALPTTIREENFNISTLEALACGVPVITTNWATSKELIYDGENGYLLEVTDGKDGRLTFDKKYLISLIVKVLKNKELNLKLKKNAIKTAQKFDYRKVMPNLVKLLKKRRRIKVRNRWGLIKDKSITDFSYLFNRDLLFFLYCLTRFKDGTYVSLYRKTFKSVSLKNKYHSNRRRIKPKNTKAKEVIDKIRRNLSDFLLLRCN